MKSPEGGAPRRRALETVQIGMTASPRHLSGTDRYYLELLKHLPACDIDVRGMVIGEPEKLDGGMPGVVSFSAEGDTRLARWQRSRRVFRKLVAGSDLVVSHGQAHAFPVLNLIGARPLVVQFHGPWALEAKAEGAGRLTVAIRMLQERAVYRHAVRFIVLSQAFRNVLVESYRIDAEIIDVVPGGVDLARFKSAVSRHDARERLGLPQDRPIVVSTRRLEPSKGIADLIVAMAAVRLVQRDAMCVITGTGSLQPMLERQVDEAGLRDHVRFLGHVADDVLGLVYRAATLSIVPSVALEGFGLSVIESLASGTPAIVTNVGGLPEVVRELDPSAIVSPNDAPGLARRILDGLAGEISTESACLTYASRFAWPAIASRVAAIYREAAA